MAAAMPVAAHGLLRVYSSALRRPALASSCRLLSEAVDCRLRLPRSSATSSTKRFKSRLICSNGFASNIAHHHTGLVRIRQDLTKKFLWVRMTELIYTDSTL